MPVLEDVINPGKSCFT